MNERFDCKGGVYNWAKGKFCNKGGISRLCGHRCSFCGYVDKISSNCRKCCGYVHKIVNILNGGECGFGISNKTVDKFIKLMRILGKLNEMMNKSVDISRGWGYVNKIHQDY